MDRRIIEARKKIGTFLRENGVEYQMHYNVDDYEVDFYLPSSQVVIIVKGQGILTAALRKKAKDIGIEKVICSKLSAIERNDWNAVFNSCSLAYLKYGKDWKNIKDAKSENVRFGCRQVPKKKLTNSKSGNKPISNNLQLFLINKANIMTKSPTKAESAFMSILDENNIQYKKQTV